MRTLLVIKKRALDLSKFVHVELYCNASCEFCKLTRTLLKQKGVNFTEHRIDKDKGIKEAMISRCNNKSTPQIFINNTHIGGYDDLVRLDETNQLDVLLGLARPNNETGSRRKTILID